MEQPQDIAAYFDAESSAWSERYAESPHFRERRDTAISWIAAHGGPLDLLDYGCGSGVLLKALAPKGHRLCGVDVSEGMLEAARKNLLGLDVSLEAVDSAGHASRQFDGVTCLGVIEYVPDAESLLHRLGDRVRGGGFLILSFPNRGSLLRKLEATIFRLRGPLGRLGLFRSLTGPESYLHLQRHQFTLGEVASILRAQGFSPVRKHVHVAPGLLRRFAGSPMIGMTIIAEFVRAR